ncbi:MAG: hypothetical protein JWO94_3631 [Verrucomicrobiaceae bacterium]|nr:hypothetical protein [Verrucomicrobiaceae bacterium]
MNTPHITTTTTPAFAEATDQVQDLDQQQQLQDHAALSHILPFVPDPLPEAARASSSGTSISLTTGAATATVRFFDFENPAYYAGFELPPDAILVGDCHLTRGDVTVIGGPPGCGKSRLLVSLAIAGQQGAGATWMGHPVHARFKTAILQAENGPVRLKRELEDIAAQGHELGGWLHITPPPRYGLCFHEPGFRSQMRDWLAEHRPGIFAIDPWNRCTPDDKAKDYRAVLDHVMEVLPEGRDKPAVVIVHHLRKQAVGEQRKRGRDLLAELSGSYVIGSNSRAVFILEPASPHGDDNRVIFTCAKNNNGEMGTASAWHRQNGLFVACEDFDWEEGEPEARARPIVELEHLRQVFHSHGQAPLSRHEIVKALQAATGVSRSGAYEALQPHGRFRKHLSESEGRLSFQS